MHQATYVCCVETTQYAMRIYWCRLFCTGQLLQLCHYVFADSLASSLSVLLVKTYPDYKSQDQLSQLLANLAVSSMPALPS